MLLCLLEPARQTRNLHNLHTLLYLNQVLHRVCRAHGHLSRPLEATGTEPVLMLNTLAATRSPALASPGIPAHPGTSASPPILSTSSTTSTASSSHPRLLTGKLSHLASGGGSGSSAAPSSATTWGRPGLSTGAPAGAAFGKGGGGFVPAASVGGAGPGAGPRLGGPSGPSSAPHQTLGRMRGAFGQQGRAGHAPWAAGAGRNATGFSRGGTLDQEFPSFQEAARGELKTDV